MTSREVVRDIVQLQRTVSQLNDEIPDAGLTLRRTAVQAITTAGTTLVWQQRVRGQGITWSGADITIPANGWYIVSIATTTSVALNDLLYRLSVNGALVQVAPGFGDVNRAASSARFVRYFNQSDIVQINLVPSANVDVIVNAEGVAAESPILHIVQLTNQAEA
jgi:hypothetical protein